MGLFYIKEQDRSFLVSAATHQKATTFVKDELKKLKLKNTSVGPAYKLKG